MKFKEGYARGGMQSLYITKWDAVDVVAFLLQQGALKEITAEARKQLQADKEEKGEEK